MAHNSVCHGRLYFAWRDLSRLDGQIAVKAALKMELQRVNDDSIMERGTDPKAGTKPKTRLMANEARIWMGVTSISDLANVDGTAIELSRLNGKWRAEVESHLTMPNQPQPSPEHFTELRRYLRKTFCKGMSPWSRQNYKLDEPLGQWFVNRKRNIKYECYVSGRQVYWRDEHGVYPCKRTPTSRIWEISREIKVGLPPESHPIKARLIDVCKIWVWRAYRPYTPPQRQPHQTVNDNFEEIEGARVHIVSDA